MPAIASPTTWRTHPQIVRGFVWVHIPTRLVRRRVNQASFTYPITQLTFDNPDADPGSTATVVEGMTVKVSSSAGVFKGWARVRSVSGAGTGTLYIGVISQGDIDFADNDYLDIYQEHRIWTKPPRIASDGTLYKDYNVAWSDQTTDIPPLANCTITCADLFVDSGTSVITVEFDASGSVAMASGAALDPATPYTWNLGDGTRTVGGANDAQITATFPAGVRYVYLTVLDDNGKSHIKKILIPALTTSSAGLYRAQVSRLGDRMESGWEASFSLLADDVSAFPEGARVIYFEQEWYGATEGSLDGHCIKFDGFVTSELQTIEPLTDDVVVNCRGPMGVLMEQPAFPQTIERKTTPASWYEIKGLGWWEIVHYVLYWHSTILDLYNLEKPSNTTWQVTRLDVDMDTLKTQLDFLAQAVMARFTCDKHGHFYIRKWPGFMTPTERGLLTTVVALGDTDWSEGGLQFDYRDADDAAWLRGSGLLSQFAGTETPYLSIAPGNSPGQGAQIQQLDRQLVASQDDLNQRTGRWYAWTNHRNDGVRVPSRITFPLINRGLVFDSAWQEWVTFTLAADTNKRQRAFSAAKCMILGVESTYYHEQASSDERLELAHETDGPSGVTVDILTDGVDDDIPEYTPPLIEDPIPPGNQAADFGLVYAFTLGELRRSRNFDASPPTWTSNLFARPSGYVILDFALAQADPVNQAVIVLSNTTDTRIYSTTNLDDASPTWTLKQTIAQGANQALLFNVPALNLETWVVTYVRSSSIARCAHTHNNWTTVTDVQVTSALGGLSATGADVSGHPDTADIGVIFVATKSGGNAALTKSTNLGASFAGASVITPASYQPVCVHMPWLGNESDLEIFVMGGNAAAYDAWVRYSDDGGSTWQDVTPQYGGYGWGGGDRGLNMRRLLHGYTPDEDYMAIIAYQSVDKRGNAPPRLFVSTDRGQNWTDRGAFASDMYCVNGWPYDHNILIFSGASKLLYSDDFGQSTTEKQWSGYADGLGVMPVWLDS